MARFGTFKFGEQQFGYGEATPFNPKICYKGKPLGFIVRRQINKEVIFRHCQGHQFKYKYFIPSNPQTTPQQTWRGKFTNGVTAAKALSEAQKEVYREIAKRKPGQTWFTVFMSKYLWSESH